MKKAIVAFLFLLGCAADPTGEANETGPNGEKVIDYAPNGLPVVESEVLPYVESQPDHDKAVTQYFTCTDEHWGNCIDNASPYGSGRANFDATYDSTVSGYGEGGESYSHYNVYNNSYWGQRITSHPAVGAVSWFVDWHNKSASNPCYRSTYSDTQCTYYVCAETGIPWPRCISSRILRGSTRAFNEEKWGPFGTIRWAIYVQADWGTSVPQTAVFEKISVETVQVYP